MHAKHGSPVQVTRESRRISQFQLTLRTSPRLSLSTVRLAERGLHSARTLRILARALGVTVDDLTGRKAGAA